MVSLSDAARGDRFEALYVVAIHCGLREGELLGLEWGDVDLEAGTLQVRRTRSETGTGHKFEKPRNGKGRSVKLSRKAVEALKSHRKCQKEERFSAGSTMSCTNLLGRYFKPLVKRAGLPAIRLHDLRHTCATILPMAGWPTLWVRPHRV